MLVLAITFLVTKAGDSVSIPTPAQPAATTTTSAGSTTTSGTTATTTPAKPAKPAKPKQPALVAGSGLPTRVARALNAHKVVVLFFYEPAASDDQATRAAIRAAKGAGVNVALFQDTVSRISAYRRIVGGLGVSQSPAMIVVDRNRKAQLLQGYLDSGTIRQTVRDAA